MIDWNIFFQNLLSWPAFLLMAVGLGFLGLERHLKKIEKQNSAIMNALKIKPTDDLARN